MPRIYYRSAKGLRIIVCGDRNWSDEKIIENELKRYFDANAFIITGGARGADTIANSLANRRGVETKIYHAKWTKFGKFAGPERNTRMLVEGKPDLVIAFHTEIAKSRGTLNMVGQANEAGIPVYLYGVKK